MASVTLKAGFEVSPPQNSSSEVPLFSWDRTDRSWDNLKSKPRRHVALVAAAALIFGLFFWNPGPSCLSSKSHHYVGSPSASQHASGGTQNPAYLIKVQHGAVAAENKRCSDIGVGILKEGGNAVDAAISAVFCTGVVNMFSSGIGGGGFMTVRIPPSQPGDRSEVYTIDFRETAPALSNTTMFAHSPNASRIGGLAIGVPGEVLGLEEAHRRWGKLSWGRLVRPSIELAAGWRVDRELGRRIPRYSDLILNNPDWKTIFAPAGNLLKEGEVIRRTNLSRTLTLLASEGSRAFYQGPVADSIVRKVQSTGGILSHSDLKNYKVKVERALEGSYRGRRVYTTHAPTSGPVLLHMLNVLEIFELGERNGLNTHRIVETLKFGSAARTKICDPDFNNNTERIHQITTKSFANAIFANITDDRTHPPEYYNPEYDVKVDHGTCHTSVVDQDGMAVALTSTVNQEFGSQVLDPETGILLNDEMDNFSIPGTPNGYGLWPSPFNYPEPNKRPLSSTAPTILEHSNGTFFLALGGAGGPRISGAILQVLLNLDWVSNLSDAIEFGRLHHQLYPIELDAEDNYPNEILDELRKRGHQVRVFDVNSVAAVVQAVMKEGGNIFASDSRKNGIASGY